MRTLSDGSREITPTEREMCTAAFGFLKDSLAAGLVNLEYLCHDIRIGLPYAEDQPEDERPDELDNNELLAIFSAAAEEFGVSFDRAIERAQQR